MRLQSALLALALPGIAILAGCAPAPESKLAAYRAPDVTPECRAAVFDDPEVRHLIAAGTAVPNYMAENQNKLAAKQAEVENHCMQAKGLMPAGGVEPVKHTWYPSLF